MPERFDLFRLSLLQRKERDMFVGPDGSREDYLRDVFSREYRYTFNDVLYHYVPLIGSDDPGVIAGRIGRSLTLEENKPPAEGLAEVTRDAWKASVIVIDPTEHDDGQKAAIEVDRAVASPAKLLLGLTRAVNRANPGGQYSLEAAPIIEVESFWTFAAENKGDITRLDFAFVVPNMFGGSDSIVDELRDFREREKAKRVAITLQSKDGLDVDTERTREAVRYVSKSGGRIRAKARRNRRYSSTDKAKQGNIPIEDDGVETTMSRLSRFAKQIFGRD